MAVLPPGKTWRALAERPLEKRKPRLPFQAIDPRVADLASQIVALDRRITALEAIAPRDAADAQLADVIAATTMGLPFRSHELLAHAALTPSLAAALADVGLQSGVEVGAWLRDRVGTRGGITITRVAGRRWRVTGEH